MIARVLIAVFISLTTQTARAQTRPHELVAGVGVDGAPVARLGYRHHLGALRHGFDLTPSLIVTWPWLQPGGGDGEVAGGVCAGFALGDHIRLEAWLAPFVRATENPIHQAIASGAEVGSAILFRLAKRPTVTLGPDLSWNRVMLVHLHHTQRVRDQVYSEVMDGWYQGGASVVRVGIDARVGAGPIEVRARVGLTTPTAGPAEMIPVYAELTAAWRL